MTSLGSLERAVMRVLWEHPHHDRGLTVREVLDGMTDRAPAYTTVMTVLTRLEAKGVTTRVRDGRAWRYLPAQSREELTAVAMRTPLDSLSREERQSAILHFINDATPAEMDALRSALAEVEDAVGPDGGPGEGDQADGRSGRRGRDGCGRHGRRGRGPGAS